MTTPRDPTQFTRESAERIGRVVRAAELAAPTASPLEFNASISANRKVFRMCTFTGAWSKNTVKTLTFRGVTSTPNTVVAVNVFANLASSSTAARNCGIAREGTAWYLIAAEC